LRGSLSINERTTVKYGKGTDDLVYLAFERFATVVFPQTYRNIMTSAFKTPSAWTMNTIPSAPYTQRNTDNQTLCESYKNYITERTAQSYNVFIGIYRFLVLGL
jgi:hypothetical protein